MKKAFLIGGIAILALVACRQNTQSQAGQVDSEAKAYQPLAEAGAIEEGEIEWLLTDPNAPPVVIFDGEKTVKNAAALRVEQEMKEPKPKEHKIIITPSESDNLGSTSATCYRWTCKISTQWTYYGFPKKDKRTGGYLINSSNKPVAKSITITQASESSVTGGFDAALISSSVGVTRPQSISITVGPINVPANTKIPIYTFQVGKGGYGTQYQYPNQYASCAQAGKSCSKKNFSAFFA